MEEFNIQKSSKDGRVYYQKQGKGIRFWSAGEILFVASYFIFRSHSAAMSPSVSHKNSQQLLKIITCP